MLNCEYYTIVAVSLTSLIPVVYGIVFSFIYTDNRKSLSHIFGISIRGKQITANFLWRTDIFILSFLSLLLAIRLLNPVPSEGWLRTLFIIILFSSESIVVFSLFKLSCSRFSCVILLIIVLLIFAAMPSGLVLHKPWNYPMFISPFYWLGWSWVIPSAGESFAYAAIACVLTALYILAARFFFRRRGTV